MKRKKRNIPVELLSSEARALETKSYRRKIGTGPLVEPPVIAPIVTKMPVSQQINKTKLEINFILEKFLSDQLTLNGQTKRHFILFCEDNRLPIDEDALLKFMVRNHFSDLSEISIEKIFYNPGKSQEFSQQIAPLRSIFNNINSGAIGVDMTCDASFNFQVITRDDLSLNRKRLTQERFSTEYNIRNCLQREQPISYREVMAAWLKQLMAQYSFLNHKSQVRESLHLSGYSSEEILEKIEGFLDEALSPPLSRDDLCFLKENLEEIIFDQSKIELLTDIGTKSYFRMEEEAIEKIKGLITRIETILSPAQNEEDLKSGLSVSAVVENSPSLNFIPFNEGRNAGESAARKADAQRGDASSSTSSFFFDRDLSIKTRPGLNRESAYQYIFMLTLSTLDPEQFTLTREIGELVAVSKDCLSKISNNEDIETQYKILVQFINRNKESYFRQRVRDTIFNNKFPKMDNNRLLCKYLHEEIKSFRRLKTCLHHIVEHNAFFGVLDSDAVVKKLKSEMPQCMRQDIEAIKYENADNILARLIKSKTATSSTLNAYEESYFPPQR